MISAFASIYIVARCHGAEEKVARCMALFVRHALRRSYAIHRFVGEKWRALTV
jgi:hypothetical protein